MTNALFATSQINVSSIFIARNENDAFDSSSF